MEASKIKVLIIYPNIIPARPIQLGISYLSAMLKKKGHTVELFDTSFMFNTIEYHSQDEYDDIIWRLQEKVKDFDVIAISCRTNEWGFVQMILEKIKHPNIVLGGPHPTVAPEECIKYCENICIGEGEEAIVEFSENPKQTSTKNFWFRKGLKVIKNPLRPLIQNLDSLPLPDWEIWDKRHLYDSYQTKKGDIKFGPYEFSRGCPFNCTYCINKHMQQLYKGQKYHREKSIKKSIGEMKILKKKYDLKIFYIIDETFLLDFKRVKEFSKLYKKEIGIPFNIMTRPEIVTEGKLKLIKDAGCYILSIGIEQGNEEYRKKHLSRHMTNKQIEKAFALCKKIGIQTMSFNMVGLPYENRKLVFDTINLNRKVKPDIIQISIFFPFPGTELRTVCQKEGIIMWEEKMLASYYKESVLSLPELSTEEIIGFKRVFKLYCKCPEFTFPLIKLLEKNTRLTKFMTEWMYIYIHYGILSMIKKGPGFLWKKLKSVT